MKDYSIYHYNMIIRLTIFIKASQAQGSETTPSGMEELILTLFFFYKDNFIRTTSLVFAQKLRTN